MKAFILTFLLASTIWSYAGTQASVSAAGYGVKGVYLATALINGAPSTIAFGKLAMPTARNAAIWCNCSAPGASAALMTDYPHSVQYDPLSYFQSSTNTGAIMNWEMAYWTAWLKANPQP